MTKNNPLPQPKYYLNDQGQFVVENYNYSKPFANFFPGIAGKYGIPMWVFYVNRGQCICSFGVKDKDQAIMEFLPANKSWQLVSSFGFRTFLKIKTPGKQVYYEPFHNGYLNLKYRLKNSLRADSSSLIIEEENPVLGLKIQVEYFTIPNDAFSGLSRVLTIENTGKKSLNAQLIDGLARIIPFGTHNFFLKEMFRTIEAWMKVDNLKRGVPFFRLAVDPADRPEVVHIDEGNFYLGFHFEGGKAKIIRPIVDPETVFGEVTDFSYPAQFLAHPNFSYPDKQITMGRTPSALLSANINLRPKEHKTFYAVIGQARNIKTLDCSVAKIIRPGYLEKKLAENTELMRGLEKNILTKSASREFNLYANQTYIDNVMRGGFPEVFKSGHVFYLYSRKHGDLERDYNKFQLQPNYLSQGNGNYRDINQNRRSDCWFNPDIKDENVIFFMNLIQSDGFNPLIIKPDNFKLKEDTDLNSKLAGALAEKDIPKLQAYFKNPFTPGELIFFLEKNGIKLNISYDDFLDKIFSCASKTQEAEHGEGFWTDHWTYNLDLIGSYLGIYPEKFNELFFEKKIFTFYDNAEIVKPRSDRYTIYNGKPRQLHCVALNGAKKEMLRKRADNPHLMRTRNGSGEPYRTTLIEKLLCLAVNKLASLDPCGKGIEMEAGKPNWFDSLNGLPALFGSSTCETFELKRLLIMISSALKRCGGNEIEMAKEVADFIRELHSILNDDAFSYWEKSNTIKESYRRDTCMGFSGSLERVKSEELISFTAKALEKVEKGICGSLDPDKGTYCSYYINELIDFTQSESNRVIPRKFSQIPAPLFLEGQMHALRLSSGAEALKIHQATRKSALFDKKLKMYKVTAPLKSMPEEIGRCRVFAPGWLENESIWLHMEYKYLLEMLKTGLVKEFYSDFKNVFIPFQPPERYGRSILENSSFLASSALADEKLRGNGFVARLSGSTAEFLQIWLIMNTGINPFHLDENSRLNLAFKPCLPGWLFNNKGEYSFNFLGSIKTTYHNPERKNTFGRNKAEVSKVVLSVDGGPIESSALIQEPYSLMVRSRQIKQIDIYLE